MLEYNKIDVRGWINVNQTNKSRKCIVCSYYHFFKVSFGHQSKVWGGYHGFNTKAYQY